MRNVSAEFRSAREAPETADYSLIFLVLEHANLSDPVRVVNDVVDYVWEGEHYIGAPFGGSLLSDTDGQPRATLSFDNVSGTLSEVIRSTRVSPRLTISVLARSKFGYEKDDSVGDFGAYREIGNPTPDYRAKFLRIRRVEVNPMEITGELGSWDYSAEPWPDIRGTRDRLPGLFRRVA